jgi:hypothetical protein
MFGSVNEGITQSVFSQAFYLLIYSFIRSFFIRKKRNKNIRCIAIIGEIWKTEGGREGGREGERDHHTNLPSG